MIENIRLIQARETNPFRDVTKATYGGGYFQPFIVYVFTYKEKEYTISYYNSSCGVFGIRYTIKIFEGNLPQVDEVSDGYIYRYHRDTIGCDVKVAEALKNFDEDFKQELTTFVKSLFNKNICFKTEH